MKRAIFLDRDGTIIVDKHYLKDPAEVELYPESADALERFQMAGYLLIIITNQSGVGRGHFTMEDVHAVNARMIELFQAENVTFAKICIAPEAPGEESFGRKPSPNFLFECRDEFDLDLSKCYMIGDKLIDLECGWNAGLRGSILVRTGHGKEEDDKLHEAGKTAVVVEDIGAAADIILGSEE